MIDEIKKRVKGKTVIVCIGNELRGDDGAGPVLAKKLNGNIKIPVINCGETPESYTDIIKDLKPETVIIVDAVDMKAPPGSVSIIEKENLSEVITYTTHNVPLKIFTDYLSKETKAKIFIIGIQPEQMDLANKISDTINTTLDAVSIAIKEALKTF